GELVREVIQRATPASLFWSSAFRRSVHATAVRYLTVIVMTVVTFIVFIIAIASRHQDSSLWHRIAATTPRTPISLSPAPPGREFGRGRGNRTPGGPCERTPAFRTGDFANSSTPRDNLAETAGFCTRVTGTVCQLSYSSKFLVPLVLVQGFEP